MTDGPAQLSATTAASYPRGRGRWPVSSVEVELDDELLALVDRSAQTTGRDRSQVIADAVRWQLTASPLHAIIDRPSADDDLDEDAAMHLAISEQRAYRAERDSA